MNKTAKFKKVSKKKAQQDTPVVVYFFIFGFFLLGYAFARTALDAYPHPIHWASGVVGGVIGYYAGWLWYRWRGDVI